jgi:ubiquinone/menaquinone biosynthesis C-methylase UbiE
MTDTLNRGHVNRFDARAATWDENPVRIRMTRAVSEKMKETLPLSPSMKALEFGCGTGLMTVLMAPCVEKIMAVDSSDKMLGELKRKIDDMGLVNIEFFKCDVDTGGIPGSGYDFIFSNMAYHHIREGAALLEKIHGALAPGGILAITDLDSEDGSFHGDMPDFHYLGFKRGDIVTAFEKAGFTRCSICDAHVVEKPDKDGIMRSYPMFLAAGRKEA